MNQRLQQLCASMVRKGHKRTGGKGVTVYQSQTLGQRQWLLIMTLIAICSSVNRAEAFNAFDVLQFGIARWDASPHSVDGVERSLDGGLRYSLQGGSYEAFRDLVSWQGTPPSVPDFQAAVEAAFANWESIDLATGLGTDLRFVPDFGTQAVAEPFPSDLADRFRLNRGAEIDVFVGIPDGGPSGQAGLANPYFDPGADAVTLTSGVSGYSAAVFSGADIYFYPTVSWANAGEFEELLTHEIGHVLGLGDVDTGKGGFGVFTDYYDDNFDQTSQQSAVDTLTNSFADLIDPLDPANSPGLMLYDVCDAIGGDPFNCRSDPGVKTPGVHILMESNGGSRGSIERPFLQNDDFAGRQFLYPYVALAGDFNNNGIVDGADFLAWQRGESPEPLSATDLADWEANYGTVTPLSATSAVVPEPSTGLLLALAVTTAACMKRRVAGP